MPISNIYDTGKNELAIILVFAYISMIFINSALNAEAHGVDRKDSSLGRTRNRDIDQGMISYDGE